MRIVSCLGSTLVCLINCVLRPREAFQRRHDRLERRNGFGHETETHNLKSLSVLTGRRRPPLWRLEFIVEGRADFLRSNMTLFRSELAAWVIRSSTLWSKSERDDHRFGSVDVVPRD